MREDPLGGTKYAGPWKQDRAAVVDEILDKVLPNAMNKVNESYTKTEDVVSLIDKGRRLHQPSIHQE